LDINQYINSGVLEAYLLGLASEEEQHDVQQMKALYPEVSSALHELEVVIESYCLENSVPPPPGTWELIQARIPGTDIRKREQEDTNKKEPEPKTTKSDYVEVEVSDSFIRIHKYWRLAFVVVFLLSKIFLIAGLYYYFKADSQQQEIERLKTTIQQQATSR
jgi:cell division protein FtsL